MPEQYPDDTTLLALLEDAPTGAEYIPTGLSPYHLEFRRLVQRLCLAFERANDLRPYQDGQLSIGVRPGSAHVDGLDLTFPGVTALVLPPDAQTFIWIDQQAQLQTAAALPDDRTACIPLASITTDADHITNITDLRGRTFLHIPRAAAMHNIQTLQPGAITQTTTSLLAAAAPANAVLTNVDLTLGENIQSTDGDDRIELDCFVNGVSILQTPASLRSSDGASRRTTLSGDGASAVIDPALGALNAGDLITITLTRIAGGVISTEASDAAATITLRLA